MNRIDTMRWTAKASLMASVAAVTLMVGPDTHSTLTEANALRDFVPVQMGTSAEAQARVSVGVFFDRLAPHGRWARHGSHGYVFVPAGVGRDWRPYTQGHWAYTDAYGWYWVSDEPFGWATYHYGRWGYSRSYGWYWVPGNVWAPAWVTWRTGGDYVGWAPIAPEGSGYAWGAPSSFRPPVAESWVFVETRYISAPTIVQYVQPIAQIPVILTQATTRVDVRIEQNIVINQPIEITQIENVVVEPVQTVNVTFVDDPDQASTSDGEVVAFQADISEEEPQKAPPEAVESADQIEEPAIIEETLENVPAEADAPSAAEIEDDAGEPIADDGATDEAAPEESDADAPAATEATPADGADAEQPAEDAEEQPAAEEPAVGEEPAEAEQPAATDEQPATDGTPAADETPAEPEAGADEAAPAEGQPEEDAEEAAPAEETAPAEEATPAEEAAPAEDAAPADSAPVESGAPAEAAPEQEEAPAEEAPTEEAPAEETEAAPSGEPANGEACPEGQETC
ncbi:hypothetical protein PZ895_10425 [Mesorhizobium sp. YIM 152430]|uniref:DUF6600 domain-containing protein n=1 Tax=Mesorhizobium sp. YIM 152430 TaxID=3031761 RepID=UPI0023DB2D11|nr:DUF6600 domain-containing protein [Mesorhizobium sp. YIM 152430]MDF1600188.1 hypothetical protein [Mesorhizobium sp. YIM 152430]